MLPPGTTLGHYEITDRIGAGGMGEVYRAVDTSLGREVAVKVLPPELAEDPDRLARFEREARVLATLNHPNIATLHGFERAERVPYLVMELLHGETLAERLARGPLVLEEAVPLFTQIADGLEAAHGRGIIHRDLKPANIALTPEGRVKILDFGLAKALAAHEETALDSSHSPTLTAAATLRGEIMGTAAYMSPEQARGKRLDKRTDIWAFGCVLYEALMGTPAFTGETITDLLAAIVKSEPDWGPLRGGALAPLQHLLRRCLQKDPSRRLHDIADARIELEETLSAHVSDEPAGPGVERPARWWPVPTLPAAAVSALLAGLLVWILTHPAPPAPQPTRRFSISATGLSRQSTMAISPDGRNIVFSAEREEESRLYLRPVDRFEARPLPGTEEGYGPFFSPDGQWVGFFTDRSLKKVSLSGGMPTALCEIVQGSGGDWGSDGSIIVSGFEGRAGTSAGLLRVPASGGAPEPLTTIDAEKGERGHVLPEILPGGHAVIHGVMTDRGVRISVLSLQSGERRTLIEDAFAAHYVPTGHLLYQHVQSNAVLAVPFDLGSLEVSGSPVPVVEAAAGEFGFDCSQEGTLIYSPRALAQESKVVWVDRQGSATPLLDTPGGWTQPRLSPDGTRLVIRKVGIPNCDLWLYDLARRSLTRMTFEGDNHDPVWTSDGNRVTYGAESTFRRALFWTAADGSGSMEPLASSAAPRLPMSWSADGKLLAFTETDTRTGSDIWLLSMDGDRTCRSFLQTEFEESHARFSRDGRWIAYSSNESGRDEVYVRAYPGPGAKLQISTEGGTGALWSRDGRELFYASDNQMMVVEVATEPTFRAGTPRLLFEGDYDFERVGNYDITPDGQRFVMVKRLGEGAVGEELRVVLNWFDELKRLVPTE